MYLNYKKNLFQCYLKHKYFYGGNKNMLPAVDYLIVPDKGDPYLEGHKCNVCGAIFLGERSVCSKCFARDQISKIKLSNSGSLYSYSVVYRSFP